MILEFIRIKNWRSFYGENDLWVSTDPLKNVTLIRAENGVGKTSLLAAINWCFFGILPSENEFENPTKLVNEFSIEADGASKAQVQIDFIHDGRTYRASRTYDQRTETTNPLALSEILDGGEVPTSKARPDRFINSVIPREMAPHFFFYGEATSRYTGSSGAKKFGEAVKGILGSTVARMALGDLQKAFRDYNKQAADNTGSQAQDIESQIVTVDGRIASAEEQLGKLETEISAADSRIERLNQELAGAEPTKKAQKIRAGLEAQIKLKETHKSKAEDRSQKWFQRYSTAILAEELVREANKVISQEDTRGKLPAPYDQKFVDEILEDENCICGRPFEKGSIEFEKIKSLLDTAGDQAVMSRVMSTTSALGNLSAKAENAWVDYERNNEELKTLTGEVARLDSDLLEISKELSENPLTDISEKEAARSRAITQKRQAEARTIELKTAINSYETQKNNLKLQLNQLTEKSEAARRYVKRAQLSAALTNRLEERLKREEENARSAIEREIDEIVQKFMRKPAKVSLDRNYQLLLLDERQTEVAKSTGENQLLGLAFTGAIAKYAKERENDNDDILLPGTVAPLVVDSPFGHLDPLYRGSVAEFLPKLASQVILLVSTSQASDAVMASLGKKIGSEYVLTRHNRSEQKNKVSETLEIRGKSYDLTKYNSEIEGTCIVEVTG
ncbi:AAA family ATPase [Sulfitobacter sp. 1A12157]|uniref:AAA family ATPase n=1 Tax=Sulfitobacter sp. 1A12157 TaxID=3368594 RepID=UPI00374742A9